MYLSFACWWKTSRLSKLTYCCTLCLSVSNPSWALTPLWYRFIPLSALEHETDSKWIPLIPGGHSTKGGTVHFTFLIKKRSGALGRDKIFPKWLILIELAEVKMKTLLSAKRLTRRTKWFLRRDDLSSFQRSLETWQFSIGARWATHESRITVTTYIPLRRNVCARPCRGGLAVKVTGLPASLARDSMDWHHEMEDQAYPESGLPGKRCKHYTALMTSGMVNTFFKYPKANRSFSCV